MKRHLWWGIGCLFLAGLVAGTFFAVRAHRNLVTLHVRNMPLRQVVSRMEWQTWETILVQQGTDAQITLNLKAVPLEDALEIIADQASCRWIEFYPVYRSAGALPNFKKAVRGDLPVEQSGWTNLTMRPFPGFSSRFGENARAENKLISASVIGQVAPAASLLSRFTRARVVPEDRISADVVLTLNQATVQDAVKSLARQARAKWTHYYGLQSWRQHGPPNDGERLRPPDGEIRRTNPPSLFVVLDTNRMGLTNTSRFPDWRNLSPEERRKRMAEMVARPEFQDRVAKRMQSSIMNTTPEQRAKRDRHLRQHGADRRPHP